MSIKGFQINGTTQKYDYNALDNKPVIPAGSGVSEELKQALLQMAQKVAYIDAQGQTYYQALYDALYSAAVLTSITAAYSQSGTVYTTDTLDSLKPDLTVTAHYDDGTSEVVTNYALSGNLTVGTSTITANYQGKTATFNVTVTRAAGTFSISNNLTGCSSSNSATTVAENTAYNATITANTGYTLTGATVSITMGGSSVTGYYSNGTISIPNVTGDVVITVAAVAVTVSSISAVFNQGTAVIYDTDSLDTLKQYLVVTATYSDSSTATVTNYTLSGTLTEGISTITVSYGGQTDTFSVTVTADLLYSLYDRTFTGSETQYIDTGINLFTSDFSWTIACDLTQETAIGKTGWRLLTSLRISSPYNGFFYGSQSTSTTSTSIKWMSNRKDSTNGFGKNFTGRHRIVFVHSVGSDQLIAYSKNDNGSVTTETITAAFSPLETENLHIAGVGDQTGFNYIGTVNSIEVFNHAFSVDEVNEFMG